MKLTYAYVVAESVVPLFSECKGRERQELLRIFHADAELRIVEVKRLVP